MKKVRAKLQNPLSDLISDDIFELLYSLGIIKDYAIRDYKIRKQYKQLRLNKFS